MATVSQSELLDQWREENASDDEVAILDSLEDWKAGLRGVPADELIRRMQEKYNLPE